MPVKITHLPPLSYHYPTGEPETTKSLSGERVSPQSSWEEKGPGTSFQTRSEDGQMRFDTLDGEETHPMHQPQEEHEPRGVVPNQPRDKDLSTSMPQGPQVELEGKDDEIAEIAEVEGVSTSTQPRKASEKKRHSAKAARRVGHTKEWTQSERLHAHKQVAPKNNKAERHGRRGKHSRNPERRRRKAGQKRKARRERRTAALGSLEQPLKLQRHGGTMKAIERAQMKRHKWETVTRVMARPTRARRHVEKPRAPERSLFRLVTSWITSE